MPSDAFRSGLVDESRMVRADRVINHIELQAWEPDLRDMTSAYSHDGDMKGFFRKIEGTGEQIMVKEVPATEDGKTDYDIMKIGAMFTIPSDGSGKASGL